MEAVQTSMDLGLEDTKTNIECSSPDYEIKCFSHNQFAPQIERLKIEKKYINIVEETETFNRKLVSYQANKNQSIHNWIRYKEGFSSELVQNLIKEFGLAKGNIILDPFLGSGTTSLTAKMLGINSIGIDILPISHIAFEAKSFIFEYNLEELDRAYKEIYEISPTKIEQKFNHLSITEGAFPEETENDLLFFTHWNNNSQYSYQTKTLIKLILVSILEEISYTRKDGQYLRWDYRSQKVIEANKKRLEQGKEPIKTILDKGELPTVKESLLNTLLTIKEDIKEIQQKCLPNESVHELIKDSALNALPKINDNTFDAVITSPPYCNRYDYTRTYALELAYLGVDEKKIRELRQAQLSCTVENKSKLKQLKDYYHSLNLENRYAEIEQLVTGNEVLNEINYALRKRWENGEVNNKGILSMVDGYFTELTFIFYELFRTCKPGAKVAFVNDNVRYAGEIIPVDFLSTKIAEDIGFKPIKIYTLKQRKGNSSQQMGKYGRVALRKSITIWEKP